MEAKSKRIVLLERIRNLYFGGAVEKPSPEDLRLARSSRAKERTERSERDNGRAQPNFHGHLEFDQGVARQCRDADGSANVAARFTEDFDQ